MKDSSYPGVSVVFDGATNALLIDGAPVPLSGIATDVDIEPRSSSGLRLVRVTFIANEVRIVEPKDCRGITIHELTPERMSDR